MVKLSLTNMGITLGIGFIFAFTSFLADPRPVLAALENRRWYGDVYYNNLNFGADHSDPPGVRHQLLSVPPFGHLMSRRPVPWTTKLTPNQRLQFPRLPKGTPYPPSGPSVPPFGHQSRRPVSSSELTPPIQRLLVFPRLPKGTLYPPSGPSQRIPQPPPMPKREHD
ncbi:hypothetical protein Nepgr_021736 [Nepenthes gracilis]|uniref:Uncharacterized protein n=1 Tax=Nepenthes gracilis TaxID=150966 RepID=A0AAD3SY05_NEPGR|nr:hypothetical protein Nepgr_021736 [Nepenthes gracilis]